MDFGISLAILVEMAETQFQASLHGTYAFESH